MATIASTPVLSGPALRQAIREVVARHLDLTTHEVYLFGSEAAGTANPRRSDIDIGILASAPVRPAVLQRIRDELEGIRTLRPFDVVDFRAVDDNFRLEALAHAERL
jgi:predicted nucleotidyltransferase